MNIKLSTTFWVALGAVATVILATMGVIQWVIPTQNTNSRSIIWPADPPALTATIKSFPYQHAETDLFQRTEEWREEWLQPLEHKLKKHDIAPELLETVIAALEDIINEKFDREIQFIEFNIARSEKWYSVIIRNDGNIPLNGIFLKFPAADYWVDEKRLTFVPERIEIGRMDQKSEKKFTFWGGRRGWLSKNEDVVLGHSNGIGNIEFE